MTALNFCKDKFFCKFEMTMNMINNLTHKIRNTLNHPWKLELLITNNIKWQKLWTSMDTIEDTQEAIEYYKGLKNFNAYNGGYLFIYGILQAITLQQDALNNLNESLFENNLNFKNNYPKLYKIREIRNNSIGHPTNRGNNKSFHRIIRISISKESFNLNSNFINENSEFLNENIQVIECIKIQETLVSNILTRIMENINNELINHRKKFKNKPLISVFPKTFDYHISKLYEHYKVGFSEVDFNVIKDIMQQIKIGVEERYVNLHSLQGLESVYNKLQYIIKRLDKNLFIAKIDDEELSTILIDALSENFKELKSMIKEIDEEFK